MVTAFFDANALIYLLEGSSALATRARSEMERIRGTHPEVRAQHGLRTPDALQAACCLTLGPQHIMLTGDVELSRVTGLNVRLLS